MQTLRDASSFAAVCAHLARLRRFPPGFDGSSRYDGGVERELVVLFADLAGYTALTEAHGDLDAATIAERFYELARASLVGDARLVKTIGDAVMIVASRVEDAVGTALAIASAVESERAFPSLRAGLHGGTAIERNGDYFGSTVNLAARVSSHARGGQVLCTRVVADALARHARIAAQPIGSAMFKNVQQPVELFVIDDRTHTTEIDPVCRMTVVVDAETPRLEHAGRTLFFCSRACADRYAAEFIGRAP